MKKIVCLIVWLTLAGCMPPENIEDDSSPTPVSLSTPLPTAKPVKSTPSPKTTTVISMVYQPMLCEKAPWEVWAELGEVKFVQEPTEVELITAYYSSQSITVTEVEKEEHDSAACEACGTCPATYQFTLKTTSDNLDKLKPTGWKFNSS